MHTKCTAICIIGVLWQHLDFWNEPSSYSDTIFLRVNDQQFHLIDKLLTDARIAHDVVASDLQKYGRLSMFY